MPKHALEWAAAICFVVGFAYMLISLSRIYITWFDPETMGIGIITLALGLMFYDRANRR